MYSYGPPHMAGQKQDDQLELTYSSYVRTQDVTLKTCQRRWMIGRSGERGSGISVLAARLDDDDDDVIKARISKMQQNSKCRLCGPRDETINHIISECSKLTQKEYKTRYDWMSKVTLWELSQKLKLDPANKLYTHKPASVLENETHKLLWDFAIQTTKLWNIQQKKRTCRILNFAVPVDPKVKLKEREKKDKYLDLARELNKTVEHESDVYTNCNRCS